MKSLKTYLKLKNFKKKSCSYSIYNKVWEFESKFIIAIINFDIIEHKMSVLSNFEL
jgi:hypothetical protein